MPIVNESKPLNQAPKEPTYRAQITPPEYRHSVVSSKKTPIDSLITNIEGMSWTVDYYSQVLGDDEEVFDFNPSQITPYHQYIKIHKYELKLQSDLTPSFDDTQNRSTVTATAILYPNLKPNKGDVVIGDIGDGRAGRFTVTQVSQKTIFKNTCYEINIELASVLTEYELKVLDAHVVKEGFFDKDFLLYGQNPVLASKDYMLSTRLKNTIREVLDSWLNEFYCYQIQTVKVPSAGNIVFDPFLTTAMVKVFGVKYHPLFNKISLYNCDVATLSNYQSLWDALITGDKHTLSMVFSKYRLVSTKLFLHNLHLRGVYYSAIDMVVMPFDLTGSDCMYPGWYHNTTTALLCGCGTKTPVDLNKGCTGQIDPFTGTNSEPLEGQNVEITEVGESPVINPSVPLPDMTKVNNYIVSDNCYHLNDKPVSDIEQQIRNYFEREKLNPEKIFCYTDNRNKLTPLERFYLMPISLFMMMVLLREI